MNKCAVIPSRADGEGPLLRSLRQAKYHYAKSEVEAKSNAETLELLRGPSSSARLGMTD